MSEPMSEERLERILLAEVDRLRAEVAALKEAGRKLDSKIEECAPFERAIYCSALIHGVEYRGPTFKEEREALRALCAETGGVG